LPGMSLMQKAPAQPTKTNGQKNGEGYYNAKPLATPATRKLARELGVDLRSVPPTGPNGRVTKDDVKQRGAAAGGPAHLHEQFGDHVPETHPKPEPQSGRAPQRIAAPGGADAALETRTPLRGLRKRIFEGMSRSKHTAAHFTFVEE